jgi:hypothetical protein
MQINVVAKDIKFNQVKILNAPCLQLMALALNAF